MYNFPSKERPSVKQRSTLSQRYYFVCALYCWRHERIIEAAPLGDCLHKIKCLHSVLNVSKNVRRISAPQQSPFRRHHPNAEYGQRCSLIVFKYISDKILISLAGLQPIYILRIMEISNSNLSIEPEYLSYSFIVYWYWLYLDFNTHNKNNNNWIKI